MDTAHRTSVDPPASGVVTYDGFISYSHAADDLLAPRLQAGLQRFAKPWWKRRAVRIFRDESSLAANPHLWSSITEALDDSGWFILLLSEDAASSEWVGKEIEHWVANKAADRILPVVTDGEFGWVDGDVAGSSVPAALHGVFSEEPRWVDLRFAKGDENLDLQNPDFSAAVADVASAIRGVPKDELASEEVRQHRRTVRTAWAAGITVTLLAVAAIVAGVFAVGQRNDARDNAELAEANAQIAEENAAAEAVAREQADMSALDAKQSAAVARARELAASAISVLGEDPQLSILLALEAFEALPSGIDPGQELKRSLREAVHASSIVELIELDDPYSYVDVSPDGSRLVVSSGLRVTVHDAQTLEEIWSYSETGPDTFEYVAFSSQGRFVTLTIADQNWFVSNHRQWPAVYGQNIGQVVGNDGNPARLLIFDAQNGELAHRLEFPSDVCAPIAVPGSMSDGLGLLAVGLDRCDFFSDGHTAAVYDTSTWDVVHRRSAQVGANGVFAESPQSRVLVFTSGWTVEPPAETVALDVDTWESLYESDRLAFGVLSPDGTLFAGTNPSPEANLFPTPPDYRPEWTDLTVAVMDTSTWEEVHLFKADDIVSHYALRFSSDGSRLHVGSLGGKTQTFSIESRELVDQLATGEVTALATTDDEAFVTTTTGTLQRWDLTRLLKGELATNTKDYLGANFGVLVAGDSRLLWQIGDFFVGLSPLNPDGSIGRFEPLFLGTVAPLDGDRVVTYDIDHPARTMIGPMQVIDLRTGTRESIAGCWLPFDIALPGTGMCEDGEPHPFAWLFPSADGKEFMQLPIALYGRTTSSNVNIWDANTFEVTETVVIEDVGRDYETFRGILTKERILLWDAVKSEAVVFDRSTGEELLVTKGDHPFGIDRNGEFVFFTDHEAGEVLRIDLDTLEALRFFGPIPARLDSLSLSPSGDLVAIGAVDGLVRVFDASTGELLEVMSFDLDLAGIGWIDEVHLGIGTYDDFWTVVTLDMDELRGLARAKLVRGFTSNECALYRINPCPTGS